ncbi:glucose 1-dehydrogenase [Parasphingorhabdus halotolerans]|uniref:Glucose 1-dehydrogenase n=1 Tax=Parasphingorhabdus halotolerans TaxID=2725558 RepID=A0A6H2DN84_9SPHN|nr:glucose 1-dehydrogenase [Parasphingorhabdus halotolerans]QJB69814.1 glucose 1-dehydrogenase [Parasphingorhabdus halotolerans]
MKNLFDVSGKVAVVTGGSSGIGAMMARGLLENGAKVYITARKEERLHAMQKELSAYGECVAIAADMSKVEGIEAFVAAVSAQEEKVDILINNAGANWAAPVDQFPENGWDKVMDINIKSIFFTTQKFIPLLKAAGTADDPARVINIASINGIRNSGMPTYAYTASKSAVIHLTTHLATDMAHWNINVNAIAPGFFPSNMTKQIVENEAMTKAALAQIPRGRAGKPEDIAGTALYLCGAASAWLVGQTIALDGGMISRA